MSCNHSLHFQNVWVILSKPVEVHHSKQPQAKVVRVKVEAKCQRENRRGAVGEEAAAHQRVWQRVLWWGAHQHWDASARAGARAAAANKLVPRRRRDETERRKNKWLLRKNWMQVEEHHSKVVKRCRARTTNIQSLWSVLIMRAHLIIIVNFLHSCLAWNLRRERKNKKTLAHLNRIPLRFLLTFSKDGYDHNDVFLATEQMEKWMETNVQKKPWHPRSLRY